MDIPWTDGICIYGLAFCRENRTRILLSRVMSTAHCVFGRIEQGSFILFNPGIKRGGVCMARNHHRIIVFYYLVSYHTLQWAE